MEQHGAYEAANEQAALGIKNKTSADALWEPRKASTQQLDVWQGRGRGPVPISKGVGQKGGGPMAAKKTRRCVENRSQSLTGAGSWDLSNGSWPNETVERVRRSTLKANSKTNPALTSSEIDADQLIGSSQIDIGREIDGEGSDWTSPSVRHWVFLLFCRRGRKYVDCEKSSFPHRQGQYCKWNYVGFCRFYNLRLHKQIAEKKEIREFGDKCRVWAKQIDARLSPTRLDRGKEK